jgi:hypothetical protein
MKFATVNNQRIEATVSGARGVCFCGSELIAKCGSVRINHWAHMGDRPCDPWYEETEWHRSWKNRFPVAWQEIGHKAENGEWHFADVKTDQGWVLEFQHSNIKPVERLARNTFYHPKLVWVVDGASRKRDEANFYKAWNEGTPVPVNVPMRSVFSDGNSLLREWSDSTAPVFFDFGEVDKPLWCLIPGGRNGKSYIGPFARATFVALHQPNATQRFDELMKILMEIVSLHVAGPQIQNQPAPQPLPQFQRFVARQNRFRRRF